MDIVLVLEENQLSKIQRLEIFFASLHRQFLKLSALLKMKFPSHKKQKLQVSSLFGVFVPPTLKLKRNLAATEF